MNSLYQKFLAPQRLQYLAVDQDFVIQEISLDSDKFADCPEEIVEGNDVRLGFPELFGLEDNLMAVLQGEESSFELKGVARFSDQDFPLYIDIYVINPNDKKATDRLMLFFEDVTEKMLLEQTLSQRSNEASLLLSALANSKDYIEKIITSIADALLVTTKAGIIKTVNPSAKKIFNYTDTEIIGQHIGIIIEDEIFINQTMQHDSVLTGEILKDVELICKTKNGEKIYVEFSCSVIQTNVDQNNEISNDTQDFIYIGRDITERKRSQQNLVAKHAATRILSESATIHEAIPQILLAICESLGWTVGELWMPVALPRDRKFRENLTSNHVHPQLQCVEIWSKPGANTQEFIEFAQQITFSPGENLVGQVWSSSLPIWISNFADNQQFLRSTYAAQAGLQTVFAFPIQSSGQGLGVITFFSEEVYPYDEEVCQTITDICNQLSHFIERKRAEAALQESEERYRDLFENASDLIQSVGVDGQFLYVNRAWKETLGYSESEIDNMLVFDIIDPDCKTDYLEMFQRVLSGDKIDRIKTTFITKEQKKISLEGSVNCKLIDGKPVATRGIFQNITERKLAMEALKLSEANLAEAQKIAHLGSWELDLVTQNVVWSEEMFRIFALDPEQQEFTYSEYVQMIHPEDREFWQVMIADAIAKVKFYEFDFRIVRPDHSIRYINGRGKPALDDTGKVVRLLGTAMDITERKLATVELRYQKEQSERLLLNVLPTKIAERLKQEEQTIADKFAEVTVMFADIVGFTELASSMNAIELVSLLNQIFSDFDRLSERHSLEKIKTIGDAYMVVGGLPEQRDDHAEAIADMAMDMMMAIANFNTENQKNFSIRIGIHSGPVVAGVIGIKKFIYDLWGDTVNTASRMESHGLAGQIQVSAASYEKLYHKYLFEERGHIPIKGKGKMLTYLLIGRKVHSLSA